MYSLATNPFSCREAFLSLVKLKDDCGGGIWIKSLIRTKWGTKDPKISNLLLKIIPASKKGEICGYTVEAYPTYLILRTMEGFAQIEFEKYNTIRIFTTNMNLFFEYGHQNNQGTSIHTLKNKFSFFYDHLNQDINLQGLGVEFSYYNQIKRVYAQTIDDLPILFSFWPRNLRHPTTFTHFKTQAEIVFDYESFKANYKLENNQDELAIYNLWILHYLKVGNFLMDTLAVSKNDMNLSWSWDHLLNALALMKASPKLAWETVLSFLHLQKSDGRLPDAVNPVVMVDWFTKPPVYGYFLNVYEKAGYLVPKEHELYIYERLKKLTHWWYPNADKFPLYKNPFDSGWDNATCFDDQKHLTTPDLVSYVILQLDYLATLAGRLNKNKEKKKWEIKRDDLLKTFIKELWDGSEFLCINSEGEKIKTTSLIRMIPLILKDFLTKEISKKMISELKIENHFLAPNGLATESIKSHLYDSRRGDPMKPNAYWRGPVWAPPMYMITNALAFYQENSLMNKIKDRYIAVITKSNGFFEDYDAIHQIGYDDISYGWTTSTYILFRNL